MPSYDYDSGGYGRSLADLMRRRGDDEARMYLQQGDIAAQGWANAGNTIANAISGWQKNVQQNRQLELEAAKESRLAEREGIQMESARMDLATKKRGQKGAETARAILPLARRENGVVGYDRDLIQREMETAGHADMVPDIFARLDEQEAGHFKVIEARREAIAGDAWRVLQGGDTSPETFGAMLDLWGENDLAPKRELDALRKAAEKEGPERALMAAVESSPRFAEMLQKARQANAPDLATVAPGATVYDKRNPEAGPIFTAPQEPKTPANIEAAILQETDPAKRAELVALKERLTAAGRAPDIDRRAPIAVIGPDGKPVFVRPDQAVGMAPASTREQYTGSKMPPEYQNALDRAILNIASAKRAPILQMANRYAEAGDTAGLGDVIRQAAIDTENVDTKNQILGRRATVASLADTRQTLEELKAKGVSTGILTGTVEDVVRKLGKTTDPELVALKNRLQGTLINYRRAATGVAFGEREAAQYKEMFPNYKNDLPVNIALINGLEREMNTYDAEYWTHKLGKEGAELVGVMPGAPRRTGQQPPASGDGWTTVGGVRIRKKAGQ